MDGFSGTTRVSQAFAQKGYATTSNDISVWSEVFATCYLTSQASDQYYQEIIDYLNNLNGFDGWFTLNYGSEEASAKRPFQTKNTQKLDAIREEIDRMKLIWEDKCVLLTSLILALDKVDNTLGHYVSYLSEWSPRSYSDLKLQLPARFPTSSANSVLRQDIFQTIAENQFDFAYFDPPYGSTTKKCHPAEFVMHPIITFGKLSY